MFKLEESSHQELVKYINSLSVHVLEEITNVLGEEAPAKESDRVRQARASNNLRRTQEASGTSLPASYRPGSPDLIAGIESLKSSMPKDTNIYRLTKRLRGKTRPLTCLARTEQKSDIATIPADSSGLQSGDCNAQGNTDVCPVGGAAPDINSVGNDNGREEQEDLGSPFDPLVASGVVALGLCRNVVRRMRLAMCLSEQIDVTLCVADWTLLGVKRKVLNTLSAVPAASVWPRARLWTCLR